jgi:hypothetical protein
MISVLMFSLFVLCATLVGCGGDDTSRDAAPPDRAAETERTAASAEVLVEVAGLARFPADDDRDAMSVLRSLVESGEIEGLSIDPTHEREGQLLLVAEPADRADDAYAELKQRFDAAARDAVEQAIQKQEALKTSKAEDFAILQRAMKQMQENLATQAVVEGKTLDRRTLDRLIETTLAEQIEADKRIESLRKQIERDRYATLLRLR